MPHVSRRTRARTLIFCGLVLMGISFSFLRFPGAPGLSTLFYASVVLSWALSVRARVVRQDIRHDLEAIALFLCLMLAAQRAKYSYSSGDPFLLRFFHYSYYIPFVMVPLLSLAAALRLDRRRAHPPWLISVLVPAAVLLCAGILTNDWHQQAFFYTAGFGMPERYRYGWLYLAAAVWTVVLLASSLIMAVQRVLRSSFRHFFWVPAAFLCAAALYFLSYLRNGAPRLEGTAFLQMQEVFVISIIAFWESCIQIGIISSNTDFDILFDHLGIGAEIVDERGTVRYASGAGRPLTPEERQAAEKDETQLADGYLLESARIRGGRVYWLADIRGILKVQAERQEVNSVLSEENTLLSAENRMREERAQFEIQNRLYDAIADDVQAQVTRIDELMRQEPDDEEKVKESLLECLVLGAYVKRRSNLILLTQNAEMIHVSELMFACRESLDSLALGGIECGIHVAGSRDVPARVLMLAYDAFEAVAEAALQGCRTVFVTIRADRGLRLRVETEGLRGGKLSFPAGISCEQGTEEPDVRFFTFSFGKEAAV